MTVELSDQEIQIILQALNSVGVTGAETMRAVIALVDKLKAAQQAQIGIVA